MQSLRILLVEDNPSDVRLIREALKECTLPVEVTVARDGVEAMDYLHGVEGDGRKQPDVILLDLNLPKKNGREVLAEIKSAPRLKRIPVVVMTSSSAEDDISASYQLNAHSYITKPSSLDGYTDIVHAIENFCSSIAQQHAFGSDFGVLRSQASHCMASGR